MGDDARIEVRPLAWQFIQDLAGRLADNSTLLRNCTCRQVA